MRMRRPEDTEVVTVTSKVCLPVPSIVCRLSCEIAQRTFVVRIVGLPEEAIVFTCGAGELLGIKTFGLPIVTFRCVFLLRFHICLAQLHGAELVISNAAEQNLLQSCYCVEAPAISFLHKRDGHRPFFCTYTQYGAIALSTELRLFRICNQEHITRLLISHVVA